MRIIKWSFITLFIVLILIPLTFSVQGVLRESQFNMSAAPATGRFVRAGDVDIFVQEVGNPNDPAVIFTHGAGAWSETWRKTLTALGNARFYAIAIDMPPFGYSNRPTDGSYSKERQASRIIGVLDSLRINQAIFVGFSFGARATIAAVIRSPERVKKLILVDPAVGLTDETENKTVSTEPSMTLKIMRIPWLRNIVMSSTVGNPLLTRKFIQAFVYDPASVTDEILKVYQRPMNVKGNTENVGAWVYDFLTTDNADLLKDVDALEKINLRTSLIWGEKDSTTPIWQAHTLNKKLSGSRLRTIPDVGHMPQLEASDAFNKILLEELNR